jgi:Ni,Fe-hydrogenase I large subunit
MKKELEQSLRYMQSHTTTGEPHNQQVISTQVETIFALDKVGEKLSELTKTIKKNNEQSKNIEESNLKLQIFLADITALNLSFVFYSLIVSDIGKWYSLIISTIFFITTMNFAAKVLRKKLKIS